MPQSSFCVPSMDPKCLESKKGFTALFMKPVTPSCPTDGRIGILAKTALKRVEVFSLQDKRDNVTTLLKCPRARQGFIYTSLTSDT